MASVRRLYFVMTFMLLCVGSAAMEGVSKSILRIGIGDVLDVTVQNHPEYKQTPAVMEDGYIVVPGVGSFVALGKTLPELEEIIALELSKNLNNVKVSVLLKESHSRLIRVLGPVKQPGEIPLRDGMRVLDAIANAGGLIEAGGGISGKLVRRDGVILEFDMSRAIRQPLDDANPILHMGDLLLLDAVREKSIRVHIMGEVMTQGAYDMKQDCNLASAMAEAGGVSQHASIEECVVWRGRDKVVVFSRGRSYDDWMSAARMFTLQDGDLVVIPRNQHNYAVIGQISKPGIYPTGKAGEVSVLQALVESGGPTNSADLSKSILIRNGSNYPMITRANLNDLMAGKYNAEPVTLKEGDILYIPPKGNRRLSWEDIIAPLTTLNILGFRLIN